ncbi:MAG: methyltransferase family protein [Planctomycetota bacterium]
MPSNPSESKNRRVEPVPETYDPSEVYDPGSSARPGLALWLLIGPILSVIGLLGWLRMVSGVRYSTKLEFEGWALALDFLLLAQFLACHSLLARGWGRRLLNKPLGPDAERPLYVLATGITLTLMTQCWVDTGPLLWRWGDWMSVIPRLFQIAGVILAATAAYAVGAGGMIGYPHLRALEAGRHAPKQEFVALPPYSWVRQPLNLGVLMILIGMPEMTLDRLMLMLGMGAWIVFVAPMEERDAELQFGEGYARYKARTPRWFPRLRWGDR